MKTLNRILLVEDSDLDRALAVRILRKTWPDATIMEAQDGEAAVTVLEGCGTDLPDLILLDVNMPRMNGHEFLEAWYTNAHVDVPVVMMLTSSDRSSDRERTERFSGVKNYLVKPLSSALAARLPELAG